jgi:Protein of unknown function (DUF2384)
MDVEASDREWAAQIGPVLTEVAASRLLGRVPDVVRRDPQLLRLRNRDGAVCYPAVQFTGSRQVPGVGEVVLALRPLLPLTIASWLTGPNRALDGETPIEALRSGCRARVLTLAKELAGSAAN